MSLDKSDILYLEINGEIVEDKLKVFGEADVERMVVGLKQTYRLSEDDDYVFFFTRQSKMNVRDTKIS